MYRLSHFNKTTFLKEYWQKKPLVIKQGFKDFIDPLSEHELAGLAEEEGIDSRIVSVEQNRWQVTHGPFKDINTLCVGAWSLLVQSVDHFIPEADQLMRAFDFIPHWRMDNLMVSYSNSQAGVGPHIDQYDVFIVQGKGSRRWQIGLPSEYQAIKAHKDLSQIKHFEPMIDEVLNAGDIVYIPPNHPHNGVAIEECLNYSVGFRAPSAQQMLSSFADYAIDNNILTQLYQDQALQLREFSGEIKQQELLQFKQFMQQVLESDHFKHWLPSFMSQNKVLTEEEDQNTSTYLHRDIHELLANNVRFFRAPGIKPVFIHETSDTAMAFNFFIEGQEYVVQQENAHMVKTLLNSEFIQQNLENNYLECLFFTQLLTTLVNSGYWYPE